MTGTDVRGTPQQSVIGAIGLLVTIAVLSVVAGIEAGLVSTLLVVLWFVMPAVYVVGFGHIVLAAVLTDPSALDVFAVELGLLLLLADASLPHPDSWSVFSMSVLAASGFVLLAAVLLIADGRLWLSAGVLFGTFLVVSFGITWYGSFEAKGVAHG